MKKLILTALLAVMAFAASALTYDVSGKWSEVSGYGSHSDNDINGVVFARLDNTYSGSQVLLTAEDLVGIVPKTDAAGITRAKITSISVKMESNGAYIGSGTIKIDAYAQNIEESSFPVIDNKPQYFSFTKDNLATVTITPDEVAENEVTIGGIFTVTLNFGPEGFIYTGKSLLLTIFSEDTFEDWYASDPNDSLSWWNGIYTYVPGGGTRSGGYSDSTTAIETLSGDLANSKNVIPHFLFTYEEEVETLGPTVTEGPADVYYTPNYTTPDTGNGGAGQILPHDPYNYTNSFCQTLYTATDLLGLNKINESGENVKAKITSFTFKMSGADGYLLGSFSSTIYVQNIDATQFPIKNDKKQWFNDYQAGSIGHFQSQEFYYDEESDPFEFSVILDEPIIYEGGSLLITWISEGSMAEGYRLISQVFTGEGIRSGVISKDNADLSNTTGDLSNGSSNLPVLKIDYVPLTYSGGEAKTVVSFANVQYGVTKATDSKGAEANNVYVEFDLEDASDCGSYDIYMGTNQIGHMTGKHGFVNFLTVSDKDQTISVKPNGGENVIGGTPLTIAAADLNALFDGPAVTETVGTMLYGSYDYTATKADLKGAAAVKIATSAPVSAIKPGGNLQIMFHGIGTNGYNDAFEALIPASATSWEIARNPALNDGVISFFQNATTTSIAVQRREPQTEEISGRISLKPAADYVCLSGAAVTEDAPAAASATTATVTVSREAASSYAVNFTAETPLEFDVTLPTGSEKIVMEEDDEYLMFYTTSSATLQYRIEPTAPAEPGINALAEEVPSSYDNTHDWTTADKGYVNISLADNKSTKVFVRTVDTNGNARLTAYREIKADGTTSGVAEIETDGTDAAEYYNLQGIRVSGELTPGIYIRRSGQTATKVTVK